MLRRNSAEGQVDGTTCTTANTGGWSGDAFDLASSGVTFETDAAFRGFCGYRIPSGTGSVQRLGWTGLDSLSMAAQFWVKWSASQTADQRLLSLKNASTVGGVILGGATYPNAVMVMQGTSALTASRSSALTVGAWYRIEIAIKNGTGGAGTYTLRVKDSSLTTVHSYNAAFTGPNASNITSVELGRILSGANYGGTVDVDEWSIVDQDTLPDLGYIASPVADATHSLISDAVTLSVAHNLVVADAGHGHGADAPALTQVHALTAGDSAHAQPADSPALTQVHVLTVADALHAHTADAAALGGAGSLIPAAAEHAQLADSPTLTQLHILAAADAVSGHGADSVSLTQAHALQVADSTHGQSATAPTLTGGSALTVADSSHAMASADVALAQVHVLAVAESILAHESHQVVLTQLHQLAAADSLHALTSDTGRVRLGIRHQTIAVRRAAQPTVVVRRPHQTIAVRREEPRVMAVRIA